MSTLDALLESEGLSRYDLLSGQGELSAVLREEGIAESPCTVRVRSIPEREPLPAGLVDAMTQSLALSPNVRLRDSQVLALRELYQTGGLFAPMRVGSGKTLVTLLAPTIIDAERPVLMVPASLREKTRREFMAYRADWRVRLPHIISYEEMGRADREHTLYRHAPDLLICDEAHRLKNLDAAVTRRVARYWATARPKFAALSGTLITNNLLEYWHLLLWAHGQAAPVPLRRDEAEVWHQAVDHDIGQLKRMSYGALGALGDFHQYVRSRRGIVPTPGKDCEAAIEIERWSPPLPDVLVDTIDSVSQTGMRPDGELLEDHEIANYKAQLACGLWYTWDPLPPREWLEPRRAWTKFVRKIRDQHIDGFDSPGQVEGWLHLPEPVAAAFLCSKAFIDFASATAVYKHGSALFRAWKQVEKTFKPNSVARWIDDTPLHHVVQEATEGTLIWTRFNAVGERLAEMGVPFFPGGTNPESARPGQPIALNIQAHATGRNLQAWDRMIVLTPPADDDAWEQMIGREHRMGQKSDKVTVKVYTVIDYHREVLDRVRTDSRATSNASGFTTKLQQATWV